MTTTTMESLFPNTLISEAVRSSFPAGYVVRSLERNDFAKGYLDCLRVLTWVGDLSEQMFHERYDEMKAVNEALGTGKASGTYFLVVIEFEGKIVGNGSLIVERKL
ncbi:hypothetical protein LTR84_007358 [Exophiala bonariae]|uniref:Glucosamine 6-phosphate N-acetyltransferase n=1 Tax=Exophiala bonariae TaxID=1690606 RepID=A0AAV9MYN1_9EURO|nr:hypothetical protein LTR84_007358 [Exophiala bonariae]